MAAPTERFSERAGDYVKYRPTYPAEIIDLLRDACGLRPEHVVADIGSGTGLSSELFLRAGNRVFGVEPNLEMREAAERELAPFERFQSVAAPAEATTLGDGSVDFVVAAQSFHWFDAPQCRVEFQRILRPGGYLVLLWNEPRNDTRFMSGYQRAIREIAAEFRSSQHYGVPTPSPPALFGRNRFQVASFANAQAFDFEGVLGRARSNSQLPLPGALGYDKLVARLRAVFDATQTAGHIAFEYRTRAYFGQLLVAG